MLFEELLLIAYDNDGKPAPSVQRRIDNGLGGAVLAELALADRIQLQRHNPRRFSPMKDLIWVINPTPLGDPETDYGLQRICQHRRAAYTEFWVGQLSRSPNLMTYKSMLRQRLLQRLIYNGILREEHRKILGLFPTLRYPTTDHRIKNDALDRLHRLMQGTLIDPRTATLMLLIQASDLGDFAFPGMSSQRKTVERSLAEREWANVAQCEAINGIVATLKDMVVSGLG